MTSYEEQLAWVDEHRSAVKHVRAGVICALISMCVHFFFLVFLCNIDFNMGVVTEDMLSSFHLDSVNVMDVDLPPEDGGEFKNMETVAGGGAAVSDIVTGTEDISAEPNKAIMEPPSVDENRIIGAVANLFEPSSTPELSEWHPRQEILQVERRLVADDVAAIARTRIYKVKRVPDAPTMVFPVSRTTGSVVEGGLDSGGVPGTGVVGLISGPAVIDHAVGDGSGLIGVETDPGIDKTLEKDSKTLFKEDASDVTGLRPIETLLKADLEVYTSIRDLSYGYFRMRIRRAGAEVLPVLSKDVLFVQDCSASITEQRLYFCRAALIQSLSELGPEDRFNIVGFRDAMFSCFSDWMPNNPENVAKAVQFVGGMESKGDTDIFAALDGLLKVVKIDKRPVIMILVTDGRSTTGITQSSRIIGEFSNRNKNTLSVFTMGTIATANNYLLDLLSYANRGESEIIKGGRWGIPDSMKQLVHETSRPVLNDVMFFLPSETKVEVFPKVTGNLYLDRPLVLYGRFPRHTENIVVQAVGKADKRMCDMLFSIPVKDAVKSDDKEMRRDWAKQKIYTLISDYTRKPGVDLLKEINTTSRKYDVEIPYMGQF